MIPLAIWSLVGLASPIRNRIRPRSFQIVQRHGTDKLDIYAAKVHLPLCVHRLCVCVFHQFAVCVCVCPGLRLCVIYYASWLSSITLLASHLLRCWLSVAILAQGSSARMVQAVFCLNGDGTLIYEKDFGGGNPLSANDKIRISSTFHGLSTIAAQVRSLARCANQSGPRGLQYVQFIFWADNKI